LRRILRATSSAFRAESRSRPRNISRNLGAPSAKSAVAVSAAIEPGVSSSIATAVAAVALRARFSFVGNLRKYGIRLEEWRAAEACHPRSMKPWAAACADWRGCWRSDRHGARSREPWSLGSGATRASGTSMDRAFRGTRDCDMAFRATSQQLRVTPTEIFMFESLSGSAAGGTGEVDLNFAARRLRIEAPGPVRHFSRRAARPALRNNRLKRA
jgi:hypothetical protein